MKERKDLQRMSAAMMKIKSPLKLQTEDKKTVASSLDVKLKDEPEKDYTQSPTYQQMKKDDAELKIQQLKDKETDRLTSIVHEAYGKGTGKKFRESNPSQQLKLVLSKRAGK